MQYYHFIPKIIFSPVSRTSIFSHHNSCNKILNTINNTFLLYPVQYYLVKYGKLLQIYYFYIDKITTRRTNIFFDFKIKNMLIFFATNRANKLHLICRFYLVVLFLLRKCNNISCNIFSFILIILFVIAKE